VDILAPFRIFRRCLFYDLEVDVVEEKRISVVSIIVQNIQSAQRVNEILHDYSQYIIGRMGIPYQEKSLSVICVVMDAPTAVTSALSGKLGMIPDVMSKTVTSKA